MYSPANDSVSSTAPAHDGADEALRVMNVQGSEAKSSAREWDRFVASSPEGHHEQTSMYGTLRAEFGFEAERVLVRTAGQVAGGAQVLVQRTPLGPFARVLRAPLAADACPALLADVVEALEDRARQARWVSLALELFPNQGACLGVLDRAGFEATTSWFGHRPSLVLDLEQDDEALLQRMTAKGRYNIRRAQRAGVEIRLGTAAEVERFHQLHCLTAQYQGFPVFPVDYYHYLQQLFAPQNRGVFFFAVYKGQPVATIWNMVVGRRMYYCWGGLDRSDEFRPLMANYLLHWRSMQWAREHGCHTYDLVGVTQFKSRIATGRICWPAPRVRFFRGRALRRRLFEVSHRVRPFRTSVERVARRLGLRPRMPW